MDKKIIAAVVAGIIVLGGGAYFLTQKSDDNSSNNAETTTNSSQPTEPATTKGSIASFLGSSETKECTYSSNVGGTQISGTMYFADGQMRNNYSGTSEGKSQNGSMIISKESQYIWDNATKKGVKFAFNPDTPTSNTSNSGSGSQSVDVNQEYDFNCKDWTVDASQFTPPSDIAFQDLSKLQQQLQNR